MKTKRGALRKFNAIIRAIYRDCKGGTQYGVDMPTIAALFPDRYREILHIKSVYNALPE